MKANNSSNTNLSEIENILRVQGVNAKGYGIIPKIVMQDSRLTIQAKAIYAYFCSFAGAGDTAFPSVRKIMFDLGMKDIDSFRKHRKLLENCGYIKVEQLVNNGIFSSNIYTIISNPEPTTVDNTEDSPIRVLPVTGEIPLRMKPVTKSNSINKNNKTNKNSQSVQEEIKEQDGQTDENIINKIIKVSEIDLYPDEKRNLVKEAIRTVFFKSDIAYNLRVGLTQTQLKDKLRDLRLPHVERALKKFEAHKHKVTNTPIYFTKVLIESIAVAGAEQLNYIGESDNFN
jgi:hypothetical protein